MGVPSLSGHHGSQRSEIQMNHCPVCDCNLEPYGFAMNHEYAAYRAAHTGMIQGLRDRARLLESKVQFWRCLTIGLLGVIAALVWLFS